MSTENGLIKYNQLLIPRSLRKEVLEEVHNARMGGHFGCRKTYEKVKQKYYWYEMKDEVNNWVLAYEVCAADKIPQKKPRAPLGRLEWVPYLLPFIPIWSAHSPLHLRITGTV